jgi:type II secretion system protein G
MSISSIVSSKAQKRGFTLVELLIVIVVIAILAAISVVAYNGVQARARDSQRTSDIANLVKAIEMYYLDHGTFPRITGGSSTINSSWATTADSSWQLLVNELAPYMSGIGRDPISTPGESIISTSSTGYNYAYFSNNSGTYCGTDANQTFILVYRLETQPQKNNLIGDCSTSPLGPYASSGVPRSNYRVAR